MEIKEGLYEGERALYNIHDATLIDLTFDNGESPLKECSNLKIHNCTFKYKYPLWYCKNIEVTNSTFIDVARSGIWYTSNISIKDSMIATPKEFRRCDGVTLENVSIPNAEETLWNCKNVKMKNVTTCGDYMLMNSENIEIEGINHSGNYLLDGAKNIVVRNANLNSKDSFWNCENVEVYNSHIVGEYLGWNSKNLKFVNCTIDSNQGMCYIENIEMVNCKLLNTDLAFERCSDVNATINSNIVSVKNPYSGVIKAKSIGEIILDKDIVNPDNTTITQGE